MRLPLKRLPVGGLVYVGKVAVGEKRGPADPEVPDLVALAE
jgi:hypothetical protein